MVSANLLTRLEALTPPNLRYVLTQAFVPTVSSQAADEGGGISLESCSKLATSQLYRLAISLRDESILPCSNRLAPRTS
jgi:hypothetical protein